MKVTVVNNQCDFEKLKPIWDELETALGYNLPFLTHEWLLTWWKFFHKTSLVREDVLTILVLSVDGKAIGIAPFFASTYMASRGVAKGFFNGARLIRPLGADRNITEFKAVLCKPQDEAICYQAILDYFYTEDKNWATLQISGINRGRPSSEAVALNHPYSRRKFNTPEFRVPLLNSWDVMKSGLKKQTKKVLRNHVQTWKKANFQPQFSVLSETQEVLDSLSEFFRLHEARALGEGFGANSHPNYFQYPHEKEFLRNIVLNMPGQVYMFTYKVNEEFVCMRLGFLRGDSLYLYLSGYSPLIAKLSAMTEMIVETFQWSIAKGLKEVNLSFGLDQSKTRWSPNVNNYMDCYFEGSNPLGGVAYRFYDRLKLSKVSKTLATDEGLEKIVADKSDS